MDVTKEGPTLERPTMGWSTMGGRLTDNGSVGKDVDNK